MVPIIPAIIMRDERRRRGSVGALGIRARRGKEARAKRGILPSEPVISGIARLPKQ
jgi:hypothetical protein